MEEIREAYPRPQFERKDWMSLNGVWDFRFDEEEWREIRVPFAYQAPLSGIGSNRICDRVCYRRRFRVPEHPAAFRRGGLSVPGADQRPPGGGAYGRKHRFLLRHHRGAHLGGGGDHRPGMGSLGRRGNPPGQAVLEKGSRIHLVYPHHGHLADGMAGAGFPAASGEPAGPRRGGQRPGGDRLAGERSSRREPHLL